MDGRDITRTVEARLIDLQLDEGRGDEADQLSITLDDSDGRLALPPRGARITLQLGWMGEPLVDKGEFEVDEVQFLPQILHGGSDFPHEPVGRSRSFQL